MMRFLCILFPESQFVEQNEPETQSYIFFEEQRNVNE